MKAIYFGSKNARWKYPVIDRIIKENKSATTKGIKIGDPI